jgi:protein-glucosylgalactosylhydroxylysine glucosidase
MNKFLLFLVSVFIINVTSCSQANRIDRFALVSRHNIENSIIDSLSSLSVGNGQFAYTVDITGLQTFPEFYSKGIPLGTMSDWGWHTGENPENFTLQDVYKTYDVHGKNVDYVRQYRAGEDKFKADASEWLRTNPHRIHLGMIGLKILKEDGTEISISDIRNPFQTLNLWTGEIDSRFNIEGVPVHLQTVCHPDYDMISVKINSPLIAKNRLKIKINFPLGISSPTGYDFNSPGKHSTKILSDTNNLTIFGRSQDKDKYTVLVWRNNAALKEVTQHEYILEPDKADSVYSFSCQFMKDPADGRVQNFGETETASKRSWEKFWSSNGAIDFSGCTDPRAKELERRVVLSQYLTKIQCSGSLPPAETGLTYNSWFGKFHLEMHWWHVVHFALWQRSDILEKQMDYYFRIFDNAKKTAEHQGYDGVRWPKMVGPDGRESPSTVGTYLIWQEPHVIFFAELLYKNSSDKQEILRKYSKLVFATADFMASYAWYDSTDNRYVLGPVLIPAQESLKLETTINPVFELVYWYWGLKTASEWKKRMNLEPVQKWKDITEKISALPVQNELYLCSEDTKDSYENPRYMSDHPIVSGISGVLPETRLVDPKILGNSLDTIMKKWNWKTTWGWDFPMLAMSAASIGRGEQAMDFLLMDAPKNRYLPNGHNYQDARLSIYLPGNGGLLTAVAKMCVEYQFPHNGKWKVKWENLNAYVK